MSCLQDYHEFLWIIKEQLPIEQDEGYPVLFWNRIHWLLNFDLQCVTAISIQKNWHSATFTIIIILLSGKVIIINQHATITVTHVLWFAKTKSRYHFTGLFAAKHLLELWKRSFTCNQNVKKWALLWMNFFDLTVQGSQCFYFALKLKNMSKEILFGQLLASRDILKTTGKLIFENTTWKLLHLAATTGGYS